MLKKTLYTFRDTAELGVDEIPLRSPILIEDSNGAGKPYQIMITSKTGITSATTIAQFLALTDNWIEITAGGGLITQNKNLLEVDFELEAGHSGVATNMAIDDGVTLTIPVGSTLTIV